jgi:hypothetical protein
MLRRNKTTQDNRILDMDPAPSPLVFFAADFVEAALAALPRAFLLLCVIPCSAGLAGPGATCCRSLEALLVAPSLP